MGSSTVREIKKPLHHDGATVFPIFRGLNQGFVLPVALV
jgi:hypothetical protein